MVTPAIVNAMVDRALRPVRARLRGMLLRAVLQSLDDTTTLPTAQVSMMTGQVQDSVEYFEQYGFTSVPLTNAEGLFLSLAGDRDNGVVICLTNRKQRPTGLQAGESQMWDNQGQAVYLKQGGVLKLIGKTELDVLCPLIKIGDQNTNEVDVTGTAVKLGSNTAAQYLLLGTTFWTSLQTLLNAVNTFATNVDTAGTELATSVSDWSGAPIAGCTSAGGTLVSAAAAVQAAIATFLAGSYLSTTVSTQ